MDENRRDFLKAGAATMALSALPSHLVKAAAGSDNNKPNILYLHVHDMGRYCQPYGYAIPTPNIQHLAEEGVLFQQAFTAGPTCSPGRASLLTGQLPHSCGMFGLVGPVFERKGFALNDSKHHIAHTLRNAGYHTALIGVQHEARSAKDLGYTEMPRSAEVSEEVRRLGGKYIGNTKTAVAATRWLKNAPKQPFFLSVGFEMTHRHFVKPGPEEDPRYCRPPEPIPNTPETRADMAGYIACAKYLDKMYGLVLDALKSSGLEDNTLVICTTEHGIPFPAMKCNLTDHGIGVILIMRGPGGFKGGKVVDAMISQIDIFPTICELLDIPKPDWLQGKSFMPVIQGKSDQINDYIISEVTYHGVYEPKRAIRTKRYKYIKRWPGRVKPVSWNCDPSPSKDLWLNNDWDKRFVPDEYLYDLLFDPAESNNLVYSPDPAAKKALEDMRAMLERSMKETDDPLLKGSIPDPPVNA